jgi:hypothetical protein
MPTLLQQAFEALSKLPSAEQEAYARALLEALPDKSGVYQLSEEERCAIEISKAQARRGEFVPDSEIEAFWRKLGL